MKCKSYCSQFEIVILNLNSQNFKFRDGPKLKAVICSDEYKGTALSYIDLKEFTAARQSIIIALSDALEVRFREFQSEDHSDLIAATQVADVASWPREIEALLGCLDCSIFFQACVALDILLFSFIVAFFHFVGRIFVFNCLCRSAFSR